MSDRSLVVWINDIAIGTLSSTGGVWCLEYTESWLSNIHSYALSPHLPLTATPLVDGSTNRHVQWYFDNLLPEEGQRSLLARDAKIDSADAFGLLSWYGAESAGSLTLLPPDTGLGNESELRELSREELSKRIRGLPNVPLTHGAVKRMSLAGAQHKLAVVYEDRKLYEPSGVAPSRHILKPDHPDKDYAHSVINEWFVMTLAKAVGLNVPDVHRLYVPEPVYIIKRFDREWQKDSWSRLHAIDACQLLGIDRTFKYTQGSMEQLNKLANECREKALARTQLFNWLIFNVLVGNTDAHLKNLSFMVTNSGIQLSPFYDLLSVAAYDTRAMGKDSWPDRTEMAWPILGVSQLSDFNRELLLAAGASMGIGKTTGGRIIDHMASRVQQTSEALLQQVVEQNKELIANNNDLAPTIAGEMRLLNVINGIVIREMAQKLKRG